MTNEVLPSLRNAVVGLEFHLMKDFIRESRVLERGTKLNSFDTPVIVVVIIFFL